MKTKEYTTNWGGKRHKLILDTGLPTGGDLSLLVEDKYGNEYMILSKYEAGNVRELLESIKESGYPFSSTGDWFDMIRTNVPKEWHANLSAELQVANFKRSWGKII